MAVRLVDLQLLYGIAGAREQFENLGALLFQSAHPHATSIRVHRGDGGIDVYNGKFTGDEGIHVVQIKFFPNGVRESQKQEIRDSFTCCLTNNQFTTREWTLYLPVDLSIDETIWFDKWSKEREAEYGIDINWKGATYLESLLYQANSRGIKEAFFKEEYLTQIREMHGMLQELISDFRTRSDASQKSAMTFLRNFHKERLDKIRKGNLLSDLENNNAPKIVLHIMPFSAGEDEKRFNLKPLLSDKNERLLVPIQLNLSGYNHPKHNFDGLISTLPDAYVFVFVNGCIEAIDTSILSASREYRITSGKIYENLLLKAFKRFLLAQKQIGVEPPLLVLISFLNVEGYEITFENRRSWMILPEDHQIDRPELFLPEIKIETFDCDLIEALRPAFDAIANAAHWNQSMIQDEERRLWLNEQ